jgi:hypothetical protein
MGPALILETGRRKMSNVAIFRCPLFSPRLATKAFLTVLACSVLSLQAKTTEKQPDYRKLVEGLASPNAPIRCVHTESAVLSIPPNYDWKAQRQIEEKRKALYDDCEKALPFLIEGCTDARYSMTAPWSEGDAYNRCVGSICLEIIAHHVEAFRQFMRFKGPRDWHAYNFIPRIHAVGKLVSEAKKKEVQQWWRGRKQKSIYQLQLDAFDWAIEKRKGELKKAAGEDRTALSEEIQQLTTACRKLSRSKKCLPPQHMWPGIVSPKGHTVVPWKEKTAKPSGNR